MVRQGTASLHRIASAFAVVLALALAAPAWAGGFDANTMRFDRISVADGLSQSSVMAVAQDDTGFLWFATENGLDRYDGINFRQFRHERGDPNSLASDFVRDLDFSNAGNLWIATDGGGVSRWDSDTGKFHTYRHDPNVSHSLAADRIRTIVAGEDGSVWIGTRDAGLDRLDVATGRFEHFRQETGSADSLSNDEVFDLTIDGEGALWVASAGGIDRMDTNTGRFSNFDLAGVVGKQVEGVRAWAVFAGADGTIWVGSNGEGLFRIDPATGDISNYRHDPDLPNTLSSNQVRVIFEDNIGRLWVGTDRGLNVMDAASGGFSVFVNEPADPSSLSGDNVFSIFQDAGGLLWIGTRTSGISKWNPRSWSFGHFKPRLSGAQQFASASVTAFTEDYAGNTWLGTFGGGINVVDASGDVVRRLRYDESAPDSIAGDRVMALLTDRHGNIWAGTMRGGLSKIDADTGRAVTYRHDPEDANSLVANGVMSLLQDRDGHIWIGTFGGGLSRLDPETGKFENHQNDPQDPTSLSSDRATALAQTRDGVIWAGTDGGGLNYLNTRTGDWHRLAHEPNDPSSLSANTIYSLHVDPRGRLWVGTREGLDRVFAWPLSGNGTRVMEFKRPDRMEGNAIYGIQSDMHGNLWMSSDSGLSSFNPDTGAFRDFHESQGLQGEEFNFGASYASRGGVLFFGGPNGFNRFDPAELEINSRPPPVVLTSLSIINEPVESDRPYERLRELDLGYKDYVVTFGISALDYTAPEANRYAYMLDGLDEDWIDAGHERRINYTNLDGGEYTLRVKAANSDGFWNEAGIALPLRVAHPPWATWWAYTIYIALALSAALAVWQQQRLKLKRESEYSRRLEVEVQERTRELNERNVDLKVANDKLLEASTTDALTGLRNRRYLFQQIDQHVDLVLRHYRDGVPKTPPGSNSDLLFLMVDLDNFKPVNDKCGHEAGDRLLLQVRDVLLDACRKTDDVIRWGGDEFLIVARETNSLYAADLAERVRVSLSDRVFPVGDGQVARITTSMGYACYPFVKNRPDLLSWEEVLGIADAAMYEAKQQRNSWLGIEGVEWKGSGDELYRAIKTNPVTLAEEGAIRAIESVEEATRSMA